MREAKVYCEIHPCDVSDAFVREFGATGVILSGSHMSAYEESTARAPKTVFELGVPVLGICYGMQTMAQQLGGRVTAGKVREFGYAEVRARGHTKLLDGIQDFQTPEGYGMLKVWMSHGDKVVDLPAGFKLMASTDACPIAAMADESRQFYGVQFHPEVTHTRQGAKILQRFVRDICGCRGDWNMPDYVGEAVRQIKEQVGRDEVILSVPKYDFNWQLSYELAEPLNLPKGTRIDWSCEYANDTGETITFGDSAVKNEMCIFPGEFFNEEGAQLTAQYPVF